jgi:hypothetical protein
VRCGLLARFDHFCYVALFEDYFTAKDGYEHVSAMKMSRESCATIGLGASVPAGFSAATADSEKKNATHEFGHGEN